MTQSTEHETLARETCLRHGRKPDALLEILHEVQESAGFVPGDCVPVIADALNLSRAEVHGVVSFYHDFRARPAGRCVVKLCRAEACQAVGADAVAEAVETRLGVVSGDTAADGSVTVETVYCLGDCALGPSAMIDGQLYGRITPERVAEIVRKATANGGAS